MKKAKSYLSSSYRSGSHLDSQVFNNKDDSYWVQKVDKLMQDKRQVIKLIADKN